MPDPAENDDPLPAGGFASWSAGMQRALRGEQDADVPCGTCTACCRSSQFVHIGPDETDALAHIPDELLFPAPRLPGHVVLGYDERGHCPMLADGGCSIYEHRPRTCRTYDCRIFPATGVAPDPDKPAVVRQARRWRFDLTTDADRIEHAAVQAAARFVRQRGDTLPELEPPTNPTQHAVLVIRTRSTQPLPPARPCHPTTRG
jgi:Fe-S-cluster containining protein